jgi:hypothetical protein
MTRLFLAAAFLTAAPAALGADDPSKAVIDGTAVDEAGAPVVGATVRVLKWLQPDATAVTAAGGRFRLVLDGPLANYHTIYAVTPDGGRQGRCQTKFMDFRQTISSRLVLKPAATVRVSVVDGRGTAVPDAIVALDDQEAMLAHSTTDANGAAIIRVPADAKVSVVVGFKGSLGFDYFENYRSTNETGMPVPAEVRLVLDGARTVRFRATDSADRPLAGIPFYPSLVGKKDKIAFVVNTGFLSALAVTGGLPCTGGDGVAVCDWFPPEIKRASPFDPLVPGYHCPASPYIDQSTTTVAPARLLRLVKCGGRVTGPDGRPAAGVLVQAEGRGLTNHYCRKYGRTASDGRYSLDLYPDQGYVVAVVNPDRGAAILTGLVIREDRPRTDLDFRLETGTLVEGRVTAGAKGDAVVNETVYLKTLGAPLPDELGKEVKGFRPELIRWAETDSAGNFRLRVGPGEYQIAGPDDKFVDLKVGSEPNVRRDFHLPRPLGGPFELIVRDSDGNPAVGVTLQSMALGDALTDEAGRFRCKRTYSPTLVYARDAAGTRAAFAAIGAEDERAALILRPAATAVGRVVGADGQARANCTVTAIVRPAAGGTPEQWTRISTYSGLDGSVTLCGLADGVSCEIIVCSAMRCGVRPVKKFEVRGAAQIDLGDLRLPSDEK